MTRAEAWRTVVGTSEFEVRQIRFRILYKQFVPFRREVVLEEIPQSREDLNFDRNDLRNGCRKGVYERITRKEAMEGVRGG